MSHLRRRRRETGRSRGASRLAVLACVVVLTTAGCGPAEDGSAAASGSEHDPAIEIREPWVNLVPGGMGAVYLEIANSGRGGDRLVAVETSEADTVEIHETIRDGGMMRMVAHPDGFEIPPRETVALAPGGKHVMLITPRPGDDGTMSLTFRFEKTGDVVVDAPVKTMGSAENSNQDEDD